MRVIDNILYMDFQELVSCGIADNTIRCARRDGSAGWRFLDDPDDARRVLIQYDALKPNYKQQVDQVYKPDAATYFKNSIVETLLPAPHDALNYYRSVRLQNGMGLPADKIKQYTDAARFCKMLAEVSLKGGKARLKQIGMDKATFYQAVYAQIESRNLPLPCNYSNLMAKVRQVNQEGYQALVSKKFGNDNSQKLTKEQMDWILARYAQVTKPDASVVTGELLALCQANNWPVVTERCVRLYLQQPHVKQLWTLGRHGERVWHNQFEHHAKLKAPSMRDSLWCADGSKLNFFYRDENGKMTSAQQLYFVVDVFSECIIGWHIDRTEDHAVQYCAFKKAIAFAGHKPFQILYDNQGGHKAAYTQDFFDRLSRAHFPAQPYNAQAKPVESIIGRFQMHTMSKLWFFTGQNITSRSLDSRANLDYIKAHASELPTLDQVHDLVKLQVEDWNNNAHPKLKCSRIEAYHNSVNPETKPVELLDMVDIFWLFTKETTYRRGGITLNLRGNRYEYEVVNDNGQVDVAWINAHIQDQFIIGYDPDDLSHIRLYKQYDDGKRFVTAAYPKQEYARAVQDHQPGTAADIRSMLLVRKNQKDNVVQRLEELRNTAGVRSEQEAAMDMMFGDKENMISAENSIMLHEMGLYSDGYDPEQLPKFGRFKKDNQ